MPKISEVVYKIPAMEDVICEQNVVYKRADDDDLKMNFYSSGSEAKIRPTVIVIHGGPVSIDVRVRPNSWPSFKSLGKLIAASGWNAVTFNHRLYSNDDYKQASEDTDDLIRFVRSEFPTVDREKIILWIFSGGGLMFAPFIAKNLNFIRASILYYPFLDASPLPRLASLQMKENFSPLHQLELTDEKLAPIFIAKAGQDHFEGLNNSIGKFVELARIKNQPVTLATHITGKHGFDQLNDDDRTRDIIKETLSFISKHAASDE